MKQWKEYLYVRAGGYELSQSDNRLHLRNWYEHSENTYRRGARWSPAVPAKSNTVGGHSICPRCMEMNLNNRRRTPEPALCKGRCRAERGGGVVPDTNYLFSFLSCKLSAFTIPQALTRQLPLHKGAFEFVRTLRETPCTSQVAPAPVDAKRQRRREPFRALFLKYYIC